MDSRYAVCGGVVGQSLSDMVAYMIDLKRDEPDPRKAAWIEKYLNNTFESKGTQTPVKSEESELGRHTYTSPGPPVVAVVRVPR